jgi:hypothetical protein
MASIGGFIIGIFVFVLLLLSYIILQPQLAIWSANGQTWVVASVYIFMIMVGIVCLGIIIKSLTDGIRLK